MAIKNCKICNKQYRKNVKYDKKQWAQSLYCSSKCSALDPAGKKKRRDASLRNNNIPPRFFGEKHWNYKGGITPINERIRHCFKYRLWRSDVFTRDNYTCQKCGARSGNGKAVYLEADHYPKMFSEIMSEYKIKSLEEALNCEELWNINNGRTLCKNCHKLTFRFVGNQYKKYGLL